MIDLPKSTDQSQQSNLADEILAAHQRALYRAWTIMAWAPLTALLVALPVIFLRDILSAFTYTAVTLAVLSLIHQIYRWHSRTTITPSYVLALSIGLILLALLGFSNFGIASIALPAILISTVSISILEIVNETKIYVILLTLLGVVGVSFSSIDNAIPAIEPAEHIRFLRDHIQNGLYLISSSVTMALLYSIIMPFRLKASKFSRLLKDQEQRLQERQDTKLIAEETVFHSLPGFMLELDSNMNILAMSNDASKYVSLRPNSVTHLSETRLTTIPKLNQMIDFSKQTGANYSTLVSLPWLGGGKFRLRLTNVEADMSKRTLLSLEPIGDEKNNEGSLLPQQMDTLTTEPGKPAPFRASITCDTSQTSGSSALTSEIMRDLTTLNDLPFAPIFEVDNREQVKIGLVFESVGQRDNCLALLKQTHATLATKGIPVPTGCATTSSGATRSDDLIKRSELALIHGKKITENGWFLHDTMHLANWDNNEYAALLRALHDGCIELTPCELRAAVPSPQKIVELHALWADSPYPSHRTSNGLKHALDHYHLLKNTSITDMEMWHKTAAQYLESHQEHLVSITIPDELVKTQTILEKALSIHQSSGICANLIIRISHHAASQFNEASWRILEKLRDTGAKFTLGDIGSGNTDIQLLKNPIFSFLHFGSRISAQSLENERSKIIFTELLDLAARLGKPSIVKSTPEYARDLFKLGASYADVD